MDTEGDAHISTAKCTSFIYMKQGLECKGHGMRVTEEEIKYGESIK
jgi:hypothetical protein